LKVAVEMLLIVIEFALDKKSLTKVNEKIKKPSWMQRSTVSPEGTSMRRLDVCQTPEEV
jgi:hypothetical protein